MRTLFTIAFALFVSSTSFAQLTPGSYVVGGAVGFLFSTTPGTTSDSKSTSFQLSPDVGKFISEKYYLYGGLEYSYGNRTFTQQADYFQKNTSHFYGARFGVTRYFPIIDRLYFTLQAAVITSYSTSRNETENFGISSESNSSSIQTRLNIAPGLAYFLNRKWMLYTYAGFLNYGLKYSLDTKEVAHNLYLNLQSNSFGIGARYVLGKGTNE